MKKTLLTPFALAIGLAFAGGASAETISKTDYKSGKETISAAYKTAKAQCDSLTANAKDICIAEAKGKEKVARADLDAGYKPTAKTHQEARDARAEATYGVARERCDDLAGNTRDVCVKEAKAARVAAKADAKAQMKTSKANEAASEKIGEARATATEKTSDARKDAAADKSDAQYGVAREKCETYSGDAKGRCLDQVKVRFGKS